MCGRNLYEDSEGSMRRCLDFNSEETHIVYPRVMKTPDKVLNIFARKCSAILTKSYDAYIWGEFHNYFIERFLNPFENLKGDNYDSEEEGMDYDHKSVLK